MLARATDQLRAELLNIYGYSLLYWLPVNALNYGLVPDHLRVLYVSCAGCVWGGFVSHVGHRLRRD